jgi:hypothetical protein
VFNYRIPVAESRKPSNLKVLYVFANKRRLASGVVARVARPGRGGGKSGGSVLVFSQNFFKSKLDGASTKTNAASAAFLGGTKA